MNITLPQVVHQWRRRYHPEHRYEFRKSPKLPRRPVITKRKYLHKWNSNLTEPWGMTWRVVYNECCIVTSGSISSWTGAGLAEKRRENWKNDISWQIQKKLNSVISAFQILAHAQPHCATEFFFLRIQFGAFLIRAPRKWNRKSVRKKKCQKSVNFQDFFQKKF